MNDIKNSEVDFGRYEKHYDDKSFWEKLKRVAKKAGATVVYNALLLYYVLQSKDTDFKAKCLIVGALGYFILPADLIADLIPALGFTDDLAVLSAAITTVSKYINDDIRHQASEKTAQWFNDNDMASLHQQPPHDE